MHDRFLANVDPIDFLRATEGLNAEETLFVVNSKTFTTAETMLNARSCRSWLVSEHKKLGKGGDKPIVVNQLSDSSSEGIDLSTEAEVMNLVNHHMCAASTNLADTSKFGIGSEKVFGFWDWVGGRYSVWSAIGVLPLAIHYGFDFVTEFLKGKKVGRGTTTAHTP